MWQTGVLRQAAVTSSIVYANTVASPVGANARVIIVPDFGPAVVVPGEVNTSGAAALVLGAALLFIAGTRRRQARSFD